MTDIIASTAPQIDRLALAVRLAREDGGSSSTLPNHAAERLFKTLLTRLQPLARKLVRCYGLTDMEDDARQACAIGIHRAVDSYITDKARFTTHATWQMRGELQSLRHRVRLDDRRGGKKASIRTCSLDGSATEPAIEIVDESASLRTERGASDIMAQRCLTRLLDSYDNTRKDRAASDIIRAERQLFQTQIIGSRRSFMPAWSNEQKRQIVRRISRNCAKIARVEAGL
ncbi:hypothetical protein HME9302_02308 [Alteripontixanthobacter maritimus]|uniref:RNA polymerase sigma-70 region 2 domain-containing protein n=1 Tax=Alteripontixanthobacter maritimus TaxID=2161824 RepID=A0A369QDU1_9SPHN|nr:hypothetical protein [Alteripontixanthobacter maritimus]RDC61089.1 hypothetical protein HME9302_02308 [Alteripontixanthobacter maritimus]